MANFFKNLDLEYLEHDYDVFVSQDWQFFLAIYVNDLLLFASNESRLTDIQDKLGAQFKMINLGEVSYYLGMEIDIEVGKKVFLWQTIYLMKILGRFQMINCKLASIPINPDVANSFLPSEQ